MRLQSTGWTIDVEQEPVEVTSGLPHRDDTWRYTDRAGHEHTWDENAYPTLTWVVDSTYWCADCSDEHEDGHYECRLCGERITPGTTFDAARRFIPGPRSATLTAADGRVVPLNEADLAALGALKDTPEALQAAVDALIVGRAGPPTTAWGRW